MIRAVVALALLLLASSSPAASDGTKAAREILDNILGRLRVALAEAGRARMAAQIVELEGKYGKDVVHAFRKIGPKSLELIDATAHESREVAIRLMASHGEQGTWIVRQRHLLAFIGKVGDNHRDAAAAALIKHGEDIVIPVMSSVGPEAAIALRVLTRDGGRRLGWLAEDREFAALLSTPGVMNTIATHGDGAVDFIWRNKGKIAAGAIAAALVAYPASSLPPRDTNFTIVNDATSKSRKLIVFVHGLGGDPAASFAAAPNGTSWPKLMMADHARFQHQLPLSHYSIAVFGYPAGPSDRLSTPQIAKMLFTELLLGRISGTYDEVFFIGHSLGGNVIKQFLLLADGDRDPIAERTKGVFLIAVPAQGTPLANSLGWLLRVFVGPLIQELETISFNAYLQALQLQWHSLVTRRAKSILSPLHVLCAYETRPTLAIVMPVPLEYADALCEGGPMPMNRGHGSIARPANRDADIYRWVMGWLARMAAADTPD